MNGPQGTIASKTAKPVHLVEKGLNKLKINSAEVNPTHKIEPEGPPEVCLTLQVESQHFNNLPVQFLSTQGIWVTRCTNRLNAPLNGHHITLLTDTCIIRYLRTASTSETLGSFSNDDGNGKENVT